MLHMPALGYRDPDRFWNQVVIAYLDSIEYDGRIGRHSPPLLDRFGYLDIAMDYLTVDTPRVPRATLADVEAEFAKFITAIETPPNYAVWHVPVVSGYKPPARETQR